jgi:Putative porin
MRRTHWCGVILMAALIGRTAYAKDLGEILLQKGVITEQDLKEARQEEQKTAEATKLPDWLQRFSLFGDLRVRHEGFYANGQTARNRFRLRARIGANVKVSDEISATVRLASGSPDDPISTNQSFERTFTHKPLNLDQAFITLKPSHTFGLEPGWITVVMGKFGVNAYRTSELVWDDDLSPEGATETLNLVEQKDGFLRGLKVNAFQWVVDEISNVEDPWMGGGQVVADTALGDAAKLTGAFADFHYENLNSVARKFLEKSSSSFNSSLVNNNDLIRDSSGKIIAYKNGFNIINGSSELNFPDALGVPAGMFGDVAYNTQADTRNVGFYAGLGVGKAGKDWYHNGLSKVGDWGASYTYAWVEKDAVLTLFSYSDIDYNSQHGSSNVTAHILRFDYVLLPNFQLTAKAEFINPLHRLDSEASLKNNATLVRTQLDGVLKF